MRNVSVKLLAGAFAFGGLYAQASMAAQQVEYSVDPDNILRATYHIAACKYDMRPGEARCHAHVVTDTSGKVIAHATPSGYGPSDLRSAYKITGTGSSSTTIAIVDAGGYPNAEADLAVYRAQFGLPACTTANGCFRKVDQTGGTNYPTPDYGWAQETALDLDMASAMCPSCKILLVEATSASNANLAASVDTAVNLGALVVSNSYGTSYPAGGSGESGSQTYEPHYNHPGIAITASSGDSGYGVSFPASSPHVTAVGGTHLTTASNARGWTETVWSGAGSGCSTTYAKPTWQHDTGCSKRTVADVSAVADPNTGVAVYAPQSSSGPTPGWLVFGGTSVAAPIVAGIYGVNGGGANYGSDPYSHAGALFDVTSGTNATKFMAKNKCKQVASYLCNGVTGYDAPTGLGTPNGITAF